MSTEIIIMQTKEESISHLKSCGEGYEKVNLQEDGSGVLCGTHENGLPVRIAGSNEFGWFEVHGGICDEWLRHGGPNSILGLPISNEEDDPNYRNPNGKRSRFQHGTIHGWPRDPGQPQGDWAFATEMDSDIGGVGILIDIGGSGIKIKRYANGRIDSDTHNFKPSSREEFYNCIKQVSQSNPQGESLITGIAISLAGEYDYVNERVFRCWQYQFLEGDLKHDLQSKFSCRNVQIVNDGDAHALALKEMYVRKGGKSKFGAAVNLSLGTAVGFGVLDWDGNLLHTCQGHNWEIGNWRIDTREMNKDLWWALGSEGLKSLEDKKEVADVYVHYGHRLCNFLGGMLAPVFHPRIIGLSGGIVAGHREKIKEGIQRECEYRNFPALCNVEIFLSPDKDSVMLGLSALLN